MTDKPLSIVYKENYIKVSYERVAKYKIIDLLNRINIDDYYIIKRTKKFKLVDKEDLLNMVNCGYILYKKNYYDINYIKDWLDILTLYEIYYLSKNLPPRYVLELVKKNKQI